MKLHNYIVIDGAGSYHALWAVAGLIEIFLSELCKYCIVVGLSSFILSISCMYVYNDMKYCRNLSVLDLTYGHLQIELLYIYIYIHW